MNRALKWCLVTMRLIITPALALALLLAGCAESPPATDEEDPASFDDFDLEATDSTGVIRGVVVDKAIVPVEGAVVTLEGVDRESVTTNVEGAFGFKDLEPGTYQLRIEKAGYIPTKSTADVQAGVDRPAVTKILLEADPTSLPYVASFYFGGYIECSASTPAYRVAVCGAVNLVFELLGQDPPLDDVFLAEFDADPGAQAIQAEMAWDSTQPLGDALLLTVEEEALAEAEVGTAGGTSPVIVRGNQSAIDASGFGASGHFQERVFNMEHPATTPPVPVCDIPNPVHGGTMCAKGVGFTLSQEFEVFTNVFFGFEPDPAWTFIADGPHPVPEA